jgi:hypothetical protein
MCLEMEDIRCLMCSISELLLRKSAGNVLCNFQKIVFF